MVWSAPERHDPPNLAAERQALESFLDFHRATLLRKCEGLTAEQLAERSCPPSPMSLLGLVRHLSDVERGWFRDDWVPEEVPPIYRRADVRDVAFVEADPARADEDLATYLREVDLARDEAAKHDLDEAAPDPPPDGPLFSLRWMYLHMIEEYARHNGHADLLRERIDGATGE